MSWRVVYRRETYQRVWATSWHARRSLACARWKACNPSALRWWHQLAPADQPPQSYRPRRSHGLTTGCYLPTSDTQTRTHTHYPHPTHNHLVWQDTPAYTHTYTTLPSPTHNHQVRQLVVIHHCQSHHIYTITHTYTLSSPNSYRAAGAEFPPKFFSQACLSWKFSGLARNRPTLHNPACNSITN